MSALNPTTLQQIEAAYRDISAHVGEAYVAYKLAKQNLDRLVKERDALVAQGKLFRDLPKKDEGAGNDDAE